MQKTCKINYFFNMVTLLFIFLQSHCYKLIFTTPKLVILPVLTAIYKSVIFLLRKIKCIVCRYNNIFNKSDKSLVDKITSTKKSQE
jgi:hypothetical protein